MHILFLSCLKATELIEKKLHFHLSFSEKIQLKMHKAMCDACSSYEKQSEVMEKIIGETTIKEDSSLDLNIFKKSLLSKIEESK